MKASESSVKNYGKFQLKSIQHLRNHEMKTRNNRLTTNSLQQRDQKEN